MKTFPSISSLATAAWAVAGLLMTGSLAAAQAAAAPDDRDRPAVSLTLDEAVRRAIDKNPDLAIVRLDTEVEAARVGESRGAFTPVFSTVLGRSNTATPPVNLLLGDRGVTVGDYFSSTGVRQRVPWGAGTWSLSWNSSRTTTDAAISSFDPSVQSGFQLAFSQPLFRDRAIDASRQQYIVAKGNQASSELAFREALVRTVASVKLAYWTLKASIANVTVQQRSLDLAEQLARENRVRVKAGQMASLDVVQAEAEVAQRREGLIRARTGAEDAEDLLRRLIIDPGDPSLWSVRLELADDPSPVGPPPDVDRAVATALNERYDIARANQDLENSRTTVAYLQNQRLPDVRLETSYGAAGLAGTQFLRTGSFPGSVTGSRDIGFGSALDQVFSNDYPTWSFGLTVSYPIGHSYETASLARAQVEHRQTEQRIASLRVDTAQAVRRAARQIRSAAERVEAARAGETLAQQRTDAEQRRYQVGLSTTFLVTQAQRDLLEAQVNLLQTMLDYQSAVVGFEAVQRAAPNSGGPLAIQGAAIVQLPTPTPGGIFRPGASTGF